MTVENDVIQMLQDKIRLVNKNIDLPIVIAIGSQSSGKSSVLEKIIKKDILPKGNDIVTRCPIKINLRNAKDDFEYVLIDNKKFTNFASAQKHICQKMVELCGGGTKICKQEIEIFIWQKNSIEITLVDLPGMTKIPIKDQPKDIEQQIESLIFSYASLENVLLLPIIPANSDIATCDALKICKQIDPTGSKTLGVLTKIDIMDVDTNCAQILQNKTHKLNLGYVGLINRGQFDLNNKIDINTIIDKENKYFRSNKSYQNIHNVGTLYFNKRLQELFILLIKRSLPVIKQQVETHLNNIKQEISEIDVTRYTKNDIITNFYKTITNILKQKCTMNKIFVYQTENNLQVEFAKLFKYKSLEYTFSSTIIEEIKNSNSILLSDGLFRKIIMERYIHLQKKVVKLFEKVFDLILLHFSFIDCVLYKDLLKYLQNELQNIVEQQKTELISSYDSFIDIQMSYINVNHPDFDRSKILESIITKHIGKSVMNKPESNSFFNLLSAKNDKTSEFRLINTNFDIDLFNSFTKSYFFSMEKNCFDHAIKSAFYYFFVVSKKRIEERMNEIAQENIEEYLKQNETQINDKNRLKKEELIYTEVLQTIETYSK
ncbi:Dynamin-2 [Binucleata daphniae]